MPTVNVLVPGGLKFQLQLPDGAKAEDLYMLAAQQLRLEPQQLRIVLRGSRVPASGPLYVRDQDTLLAAPQRSAPPERVVTAVLGARGGERNEDDEEEDLKFQVPERAPRWQKSLARALQRARCPDLLLVWLFQVGVINVLMLVICTALAPVMQYYEFGPVFILTCIIAAIFMNLGRRQEGEASAYSIFNGFRRLPGQLDVDAIDQQIRHGHM